LAVSILSAKKQSNTVNHDSKGSSFLPDGTSTTISTIPQKGLISKKSTCNSNMIET
jgi:hypothetical protein